MTILYLSLYASTNLMVFYVIGEKLNLDKKLKYILISANPFILVVIAYGIYSLTLIDYWPKIYILIVSVVLVFSGKELKLILRKIKMSLNLVIIFFLFAFFYTYDARNHLTIGAPDTLASFEFVLKILNFQNTNYQPGLALYLAPVIVDFKDQINITLLASFLGLLVVSHLYILLLALNRKAALYFILFLPLPIFYQLNLLLIGMSSTTLGILGFSVILVITLYNTQKKEENRSQKGLILIIFIGISLSTPSLFVYLIPLYILGIFVSYFFYSSYIAIKHGWLLVYLIISFTAYFLNAAYNVQERIFVKSEFLSQINSVTSPYSTNRLYDLLFDFFEISIRPINSLFNAFGWASLFVLFLILVFSILKKDRILFILSMNGVYFGLVTFFGIFELNIFQGRSGLYYMTLILVTISYILALIFKSIKQPFIYLVILINSIYCYSIPLEHYRYHDEALFFDISNMLESKNIDPQSTVFSTISQINIVSDDFKIRSDLVDLYEWKCSNEQTLLILDFNKKLLDPIFSRQFTHSEIRDEELKSRLEKLREEKIAQSSIYEKLAIQYGFRLIYKNENYKIYSIRCLDSD